MDDTKICENLSNLCHQCAKNKRNKHEKIHNNIILRSQIISRLREKMTELRAALWNHLIEIRDADFFPEHMMHVRSAGSNPYEMIRSLPERQYRDILFAAGIATDRSANTGRLIELTRNSEEAIRYWAVRGLLIRLCDTSGPDGTKPTERTAYLYSAFRPTVEILLSDSSAEVKIVAAEIMGRFGSEADVALAMRTLMPLMPFTDPFDAIRTQSALWSVNTFAHRLRGDEYGEDIAKLLALEIVRIGRAVATARSIILSIHEKSQGLPPDYSVTGL